MKIFSFAVQEKLGGGEERGLRGGRGETDKCELRGRRKKREKVS